MFFGRPKKSSLETCFKVLLAILHTLSILMPSMMPLLLLFMLKFPPLVQPVEVCLIFLPKLVKPNLFTYWSFSFGFIALQIPLFRCIYFLHHFSQLQSVHRMIFTPPPPLHSVKNITDFVTARKKIWNIGPKHLNSRPIPILKHLDTFAHICLRSRTFPCITLLLSWNRSKTDLIFLTESVCRVPSSTRIHLRSVAPTRTTTTAAIWSSWRGKLRPWVFWFWFRIFDYIRVLKNRE